MRRAFKSYPMALSGLISTLSFGFLLICADGFHAALKQGPSLKSLLVAIQDDSASRFQRHRLKVLSFPAAQPAGGQTWP